MENQNQNQQLSDEEKKEQAEKFLKNWTEKKQYQPSINKKDQPSAKAKKILDGWAADYERFNKKSE